MESLTRPYLGRFSEFDDHKAVWRFEDSRTGLRGFVAIHNENLGPAVGGTRYWQYKNEIEALKDVLRLSKAMSYKCALAGVKFGGGKGVIIADSSKRISAKMLAAYAATINKLRGRFYTGEDVGLTQTNANYLRRHSKFIIGSSRFSGDPGPWASLSVFYSIKAVADLVLNKSMSELFVAIKGLGKVGGGLCKILNSEKARIICADIDGGVTRKMKKQFSRIQIVKALKIHRQNVDVYSPCALGGELTTKRIGELNCLAVCGGANNQLDSPGAAENLTARGIFYVPDFVANSGGLINVVDELNAGGYNRQRVAKNVEAVYNRVEELITKSRESQISPSILADKMAINVLSSKRA